MPDDPQPTTPTTPDSAPAVGPALRSQPPGSVATTPVRPPLKPPAAKPPTAPVTAEARERGRLMGLAAVGLAAVIAIVVTIGIFLPAIGTMLSGSLSPVEVAKLPAQILVCDRDYARVAAEPETLAAARTRAGGEPVIAGIGGGCPTDVCGANGACLTTIFVRTTDDRYAPYEVMDESS